MCQCPPVLSLAPRSQEALLPPVVRRAGQRPNGGGCFTMKDKERGSRGRCVGLFAASFCGCGVIGFVREIVVAESLSFAVHAVGELVTASPALQSLGYDDGCHLAEALQRHSDPRLRRLDIWIDLFHLFGHVRASCFLRHNPLTRIGEHDRAKVTVHAEACRKRLLQHIDVCGKVRNPRALQARFGFLWQHGRGRSMRLFAVGRFCSTQACHALADLESSSLPIKVEILRFGHLQPVVLTLTTFSARSRFIAALDILSGRLARAIQLQRQRLPRHSQLNAWWRSVEAEPVTKHFVAARVNLREHVQTAPLPFDVIFVYGQNTSIAEQNWVYLNKFRHSMRNMAGAQYLLFAHRIAHLRNAVTVAKL